MDLLEVMQKRRSVRAYTDQSIPMDTLEKVIQAGLLSASSRSIRPWELLVVREKKTLDAMSQCRIGSAKMLKQASCAIVVLADEKKSGCMGGGLLHCHGEYAPDGEFPGDWQLLDSGKTAGSPGWKEHRGLSEKLITFSVSYAFRGRFIHGNAGGISGTIYDRIASQ